MIFPPRKISSGEQLTARHYNDLLDYVRRITPLAGVATSVDYKSSGAIINAKPQVQAIAAAVEELKPFTVRRHAVEITDPNTGEVSQSVQWEIYLPKGCAAYGVDCAVMNNHANTTEHHTEDPSDWYKINVTEEPGEFVVAGHIKSACQIAGVDTFDTWAKPYLYVDVKTIDDASVDGKEGDVLTQTIATIKIETTEDGETTSSIHQVVTGIISLLGCERTYPFALVWRYTVDENSVATLSNLYVVRNQTNIAGYDITINEGDTFVDVIGKNFVYCKILTDTGPYTIEVIAVTSGEENSLSQSDVHTTFIKLWQLEDNCVTYDLRENLNRALIYR